MLNLNHLFYFYVAAQHKTITSAAKSLGISQPSLTSQIKLLENQLNRQLFRKTGRNVVLTMDGEQLHNYCKPIFNLVQDLERKMQVHAETRTTLKVGFTEQIEGTFVAELISKILTLKIHQRSPRMTVVSERKEVLLNQLKNHELDLIFTNTSTTEPDIQVLQHYKLPVGLYLSSKLYHELNPKHWTDLFKVRGLGLALPNFQVRLRHEIDDHLERANVKSPVLFESDTIALVVRAVVDHVGLGFFPKPYLDEEERAGRVVCVSGEVPLWTHSLYVTAHHLFEQTPAINEMMMMLKQYLSESASGNPASPTDKGQNQTLPDPPDQSA